MTGAWLAALAVLAQEAETYAPEVAPASGEGRAAMAAFEVPEGFELSLFAAEPMLANPVSFCVDDQGAFYVAETFRLRAGVFDIRDHMDWLDDDLASRTVGDRLRMMREHLGEGFDDLDHEHERVRRLVDPDGDGAADESQVFADGFSSPSAGVAAGLVAHEGDLYYTCIPDLWRLADRDGDGVAEERQVLSTGYGVHFALIGHDLHGPVIGPDGRLYFTCGDRGFHVETEEGVIAHPHAGAVLRCDLDGSNLEVVHTGLRNPQDLAFDDYGNLFTADNNSDGGDRARLVQVVEGADGGWRYAYQWLVEPDLRGPWNAERLWEPHFEGQAAYVLPPIDNLANGPSGLAYDPGTGFGEAWRGRFYLCDFRGEASKSGIHAFTLEPRGAGFALGSVEPFVWGALATDVAFAPDGALYFTDWVHGWHKTGKGRIYRVADKSGGALARETRDRLAKGFTGEGVRELGTLLGHPDRRVRMRAQFELASRGEEGAAELARSAEQAPERLAVLHAMFGLGMVGRTRPEWLASLIERLDDADAEVRAAAVRVLGDARLSAATPALIERLSDESARVRARAALAVGRLGAREAFPRLVELLRETGDTDPVLRHALVMGLAGTSGPNEQAPLAEHPSVAVRLGAVVALRRRGDPSVARFLGDREPRVALEAARAVYDLPIEDALSELAALAEGAALRSPPLARRVVNANYRLGGRVHAERVARLASDPELDPDLRCEALTRLAAWAAPPPRDPLLGEWRPLVAEGDEREAGFLPEIAAQLEPALDRAPDEVAARWIALVRAAGATSAAPRLEAWVRDERRGGSLRAAALSALEALGTSGWVPAVDVALADSDDELRAAGLEALALLAPADFLARAPRILSEGGTAERRAAYRLLGALADAPAAEVLARELELLDAGLVPAELALDLVLAAEARGDAELDRSLAGRRAAARELDPVLAPWLDSLFGGDPARGRRLFDERADLACLRCHAVVAEPGDVRIGPDLAGIGSRATRLEMLEAIVDPNRRTSAGFEGSVLFLTAGGMHAGRVIDETDERVRLLKADGTTVDVRLEEVAGRRRDLSAMPEDLGRLLSRAEMRDLLAYLAEL